VDVFDGKKAFLYMLYRHNGKSSIKVQDFMNLV